MWGRSTKIERKIREEAERAAKRHVEGKMIGHVGIYKAKNICLFAMAKGSSQQRRVSTQRRKELRYCVPESGQLRRCRLES